MKRLLMAALLLCLPATAIADERTKIDTDTYQTLGLSFYNGCLNGNNSAPKRAFCSCGAVYFMGNAVQVVMKYKLVYDDQLPSHLGEMTLSKSQAQTCLNKAKE